MFTGFASENSPAIQVWDFFRAFASTSAVRSVALADDCAPIQYFRTGATTTAINVYLPTSPIEGKQIKICNAMYGSSAQGIIIYTSDANGGGTTSGLISVGAGQTLDLCYSKSFISLTSAGGVLGTGWVILNQAPDSAVNYLSVISGGSTNTASGQYSTVAGGSANTASNSYSVISGGVSNTASSTYATISGGNGNTASGAYSIVAGGGDNVANATVASIIGGSDGTTRSVAGNFVTPASNNPISTQVGLSQVSRLVLGTQTTDATSTVLRSNTSAASTSNQVVLPNNSAYVFQGRVIANVTGAGNTASWKFEGAIKRGASAGTTALVAAVTPTVIAQDAGAVTWTVAVSADTTNGALAVTITGQAATTIRWVCSIESTEVTY